MAGKYVDRRGNLLLEEVQKDYAFVKVESVTVSPFIGRSEYRLSVRDLIFGDERELIIIG